MSKRNKTTQLPAPTDPPKPDGRAGRRCRRPATEGAYSARLGRPDRRLREVRESEELERRLADPDEADAAALAALVRVAAAQQRRFNELEARASVGAESGRTSREMVALGGALSRTLRQLAQLRTKVQRGGRKARLADYLAARQVEPTP